MEGIAKRLVDKMVTAKVIAAEQKEYYAYGAILLFTSFFLTALMLGSGIAVGCIISVIAYCAAYWGLHTVEDTYHCKKYYRCALLTMGMFYPMLALTWLVDHGVLMILTILLLAVYTALIAGMLIRAKVKHRVQMAKRILTGRIIFFATAVFTIITWHAPLAFPFCYGMVAITIMQMMGGLKNEQQSR